MTFIVVIVVQLVWGIHRVVITQSSGGWVIMSIVLWMVDMRVIGGHWRIVALVIIFGVGAWGVVAWSNSGIDRRRIVVVDREVRQCRLWKRLCD